MKPATTLALVALAVSLGGCQSIVDAFGFSGKSSASTYQLGQSDLDEGREHLRAGRLGNAIAPLHRAALNPQTSGDALNALGVTYAKLGRADLAERYFVAAVKTDRQNERYAANLARFYSSDLASDMRLAYAQREKAAQSYAAYASTVPEKPFEPEPDTRLVLSGGETRSITVSGASQSTRVSRSSAPVQRAAPKPAPTRVRVSGGTIRPASSASRPAEISIGGGSKSAPYPARVRIGSADTGSRYPVRVRLPSRPATASDD
ncbi:MAG: hypothetical protein HKO08_06270 [Erythrobacter sp.]|nr:hypothetical protein [Erythrobacter sp.]